MADRQTERQRTERQALPSRRCPWCSWGRCTRAGRTVPGTGPRSQDKPGPYVLTYEHQQHFLNNVFWPTYPTKMKKNYLWIIYLIPVRIHFYLNKLENKTKQNKATLNKKIYFGRWVMCVPMVMAVFSSKVLGVWGRLMMLMRGVRIEGTYGPMSAPGKGRILGWRLTRG